MPVLVITTRATPDEVERMLEAFAVEIKLVVDVARGILAGGGEAHVDCVPPLVALGSRREDLWGVWWKPATKEIIYDSIINIRPTNRRMDLGDAAVRRRVEQIVLELLGGV